ncbi:MAG: hypothetical protein FJX75_03395 [Armatimonadetes bacterium]|nr:hypothetical protein [Armatimonadota bacterium]MBM3957545.1 hypothetical protein [Gemmatimonadota bacterium]
MPQAPRRLKPDDTLYRAVRPGECDEQGPLRSAFEYTGIDRSTGRPSATLSFSVRGEATPSDALAAISRQSVARRLCGTGKRPPSPEAMYRHGFRVAALSARPVLEACARAGTEVRVVADPSGNEVEPNGHLQLHAGSRLARTWASHSRILSERETFGG